MKALTNLDLEDLIFLDIETTAAVKTLEKGTPLWDSWDYKLNHGRELIKADDPVKSFSEQAALYPEYGQIVCITIGKIKDGVLKLKDYYGKDEKLLLTEFTSGLSNIIAANKKSKLVGHALLGFDIPYIVRRCIVHQIPLPVLIDINHLKPWNCAEIIVDTMDLWKGTAFNGGSLIAIAVALGLHNPKDDLAGYETTNVYYNEPNGLERIVEYCRKDVLTVANIVRKCRYEPILKAEVVDVLKTKPVGPLTRTFNSGGELTAEDAKQITKAKKGLNKGDYEKADELLNIVTGN